MNKNGIIALIVVVVAVGAGILWYGSAPPAAKKSATVDFVHEGNLVINNAGLRPDTWYLVYEAPGAPAQSAALVFDSESTCAGAPCDPNALEAGQRVEVRGVTSGDQVLVRTLTPVEVSAGDTPILLYFYDPSKDVDASGNILCSAAGLVAVPRTVPASDTQIADAVRLLLSGELSQEERASGVETEFPLEGLALVSATLEEGTLTLVFNDPSGRTSGGSCRAGILWHQIEATAMQFPGVEEVRFEPEELFQP
jgi:hypothetical protein